MARKGRLVFPGAVYHLINRGNYRRDLFEADETRAAFEDCLFAACKKSSWLLHAFVIMRNHFHLPLENALAALGRSAAEAAVGPKSEPWKLALASWMIASTQASRSWLTARLNLGTPSALSHNLSLFGRRHRSSDPSYARLIALSSS